MWNNLKPEDFFWVFNSADVKKEAKCKKIIAELQKDKLLDEEGKLRNYFMLDNRLKNLQRLCTEEFENVQVYCKVKTTVKNLQLYRRILIETYLSACVSSLEVVDEVETKKPDT